MGDLLTNAESPPKISSSTLPRKSPHPKRSLNNPRQQFLPAAFFLIKFTVFLYWMWVTIVVIFSLNLEP